MPFNPFQPLGHCHPPAPRLPALIFANDEARKSGEKLNQVLWPWQEPLDDFYGVASPFALLPEIPFRCCFPLLPLANVGECKASGGTSRPKSVNVVTSQLL